MKSKSVGLIQGHHNSEIMEYKNNDQIRVFRDQETGQSSVGISRFDAWYFAEQLIQCLAEGDKIIYV